MGVSPGGLANAGAVGKTEPLIVVVVYTEWSKGAIRIISLRKAQSYERKRYEQALRDRLGTS